MKNTLLLIFLALVQLLAKGQNLDDRLKINPQLKPFYHGVASGDPTDGAVVIWTRITPDGNVDNVDVKWRMATDTAMENVVAEGVFETNFERDFTVKIDVQGLQSNSTYYYDFFGEGRYSIRGRTKTAPKDKEVDNLRFAIVSCSSYEHGYFNAYQQIADRNDIDAVVHLGDYIYEYQVGGYGSNIEGRSYIPENEIVSLDDYRLRYSLYRLDNQLKNIHQQYPFINVWDDHEFTDNAYKTGANNHQEATEGEWETRKLNALKAYKEWLPVRDFDYTKIYRTMHYGNLVDLYMLDTRVSERELQASVGSPEIYNAERKLIGDVQFEWLKAELEASTAQYQILGQQIMFSPLRVAGVPINTDQWDGYNAERQRVMDVVKAADNIENFVVLTGDIHTSWAMDIPDALYEPVLKTGSVGVEFVTSSITSPGLDIPLAAEAIKLNNLHMRYVDLVKKGYMLLNVDSVAIQAEWYYTAIDEITEEGEFGAAYKSLSGSKHVVSGDGPSKPGRSYPSLAPLLPIGSGVVGVSELSELVFFGIYPNPFLNEFVIQYHLEKASKIDISLYDVTGKKITDFTTVNSARGMHYMKVNAADIKSGTYSVVLNVNGAPVSKTLIKK
jgi:alkaline phosphatase D